MTTSNRTKDGKGFPNREAGVPFCKRVRDDDLEDSVYNNPPNLACFPSTESKKPAHHGRPIIFYPVPKRRAITDASPTTGMKLSCLYSRLQPMYSMGRRLLLYHNSTTNQYARWNGTKFDLPIKCRLPTLIHVGEDLLSIGALNAITHMPSSL
eukprot:scaffold1428_cov159-Amphora_coffeaeformis.AAC.17